MLLAVLLSLLLAARALRERLAPESTTPLSWLILLGECVAWHSVPFYALSPLLFSVLGLVPPWIIIARTAKICSRLFLDCTVRDIAFADLSSFARGRSFTENRERIGS